MSKTICIKILKIPFVHPSGASVSKKKRTTNKTDTNRTIDTFSSNKMMVQWKMDHFYWRLINLLLTNLSPHFPWNPIESEVFGLGRGSRLAAECFQHHCRHEVLHTLERGPPPAMGVKWWVGESWTNERWPMARVSFLWPKLDLFFLKGSRISVEKILFVCLFSFLDIFSELIWKHLLTVLFLLVQWVWYMQNESV